MPDLMQQAQHDTAARLNADAAFEFVPVLVNRPRDAAGAIMIRETLNKALMGISKKNGKGGIAIMVMMPDGEVPNQDSPGPQVDLILTVRIVEQPTFNEGTNGTHISAEQCALSVLKLLHLWSPGYGVLQAEKKAIKEGAAPEGSIAYDVVLRMHVPMQPRDLVQRPRITRAGSLVTMTCVTADAALWWTQDGTLPTPDNGSLYEEPVDVSAMDTGTTIRVCGYKTGLSASDAALLTL